MMVLGWLFFGFFGYLVFVFVIYCVKLLLGNYQIVVFGLVFVKGKVLKLLVSCLDCGIGQWCIDCDVGFYFVIIFLGGKGDDELCVEGEVMVEYLVEYGIFCECVVVENQVVNIDENIFLSWQVMFIQVRLVLLWCVEVVC